MKARAVQVFDIDPSWYTVSAVAGSPVRTSFTPTATSVISPLLSTPT